MKDFQKGDREILFLFSKGYPPLKNIHNSPLFSNNSKKCSISLGGDKNNPQNTPPFSIITPQNRIIFRGGIEKLLSVFEKRRIPPNPIWKIPPPTKYHSEGIHPNPNSNLLYQIRLFYDYKSSTKKIGFKPLYFSLIKSFFCKSIKLYFLQKIRLFIITICFYLLFIILKKL